MATRLITRRRAIVAGLASIGGVAASRLPLVELPPTYGNLLRAGDALTYAAHRLLLPQHALVREYTLADLTSFPAIGTTSPAVSVKTPLGEQYRDWQAGGFRDWRLSVEGLVATPRTFSLADLKALPSRTQITRHTCEEGWTAIGQWTGVPLATVLEAAGILPAARFAVLHSVDAGRFVTGIPAFEHAEWRKASIVFRSLPLMKKRIEELEQKIAELEEKLAACQIPDR